MKRLLIYAACLVSSAAFVLPASTHAQPAASAQGTLRQRNLVLPPQPAKTSGSQFRLLAGEEEQEPGNAVPVMLRMVYEQQGFMKELYPKLQEYAEMEVTDPRLKELPYGSFAKQLIRAGSMSYANWEYPLRSDRPYIILLPDLQSQRQLAGMGMSAWTKGLLGQGKTTEALTCIKAQLGCSRHCAATPIVVCHLVALTIAHQALDNLELAMQTDDCPNLYWSLAALPPTLQELGPMVRWELWATPARLDEPLPAIGDAQWAEIARRFAELYAESSSEPLTEAEGAQVIAKIQQLAKRELPAQLGFSAAEIDRMTPEELVMRTVYMHYCRLRHQVEPLAFQSPRQVLAAKKQIEAENDALLAATGAKSSPYPVIIPHGILACRLFDRRIKLLQTVEALRDYASRHDGALPDSLAQLELPAPLDPFTDEPFEYKLADGKATLRQADIAGFDTNRYEYVLSAAK